MICQPLLAGCQGLGFGDEQGANRLAGSQSDNRVNFSAAGDGRVGATAGSALGGDNLTCKLFTKFWNPLKMFTTNILNLKKPKSLNVL